MREEWRPVPGFEEWYEVSSRGRVRSWKNARHGRRQEPRQIQLIDDGKGYLFFNATRDGGAGKVYVHRAVCEAWHGPQPECAELVRHLDDIPTRNVPDNLAWGTYRDNYLDAVANGRPAYGFTGKLSHLAVIEIRRKVGMGEWSAAKAARAYGISASSVSGIVAGKSYRHVVPRT